MEWPKRWIGTAIAVGAIVSLATVARVMGASWPQIVWGALGCLALPLVAECLAWLTTGGPLRLEKRSAAGTERRTDRPE